MPMAFGARLHGLSTFNRAMADPMIQQGKEELRFKSLLCKCRCKVVL